MTPQEIYQAAIAAGFNPQAAVTVTAIALAESNGGDPTAHNPNAGTGDNSYGLMQINMLGAMGPDRRRRYGLTSNNDLFDPATNMRVAFGESSGGSNFKPWTTFNKGIYKQFLPAAQAAAQGQNLAVPGAGSGTGLGTAPAEPESLGSQLQKAAGMATGGPPAGPLDVAVPSIVTGPQSPPQPAPAQSAQPAVATEATGNPAASAAIKAAVNAIGTPYVWGGNDLGKGVDCSGLIQQAYKAAGINLPRVSDQQIASGQRVDPAQMQPGDILGWAYNNSLGGGATHVALYIGAGKMIEALNRNTPVQIVNVRTPQFVTRPGGGGRGTQATAPATATPSSTTIQPQNNPDETLQSRLAAIDNAFSSALAMGGAAGPLTGRSNG